MKQLKNGKYLTAIGERSPAIMCEKHAKVFEHTMLTASVPHTIYELDDDDGPYYCHACDLTVAKEYAEHQRITQAAQPRIILPGEFN
jgi:hypothetical protein